MRRRKKKTKSTQALKKNRISITPSRSFQKGGSPTHDVVDCFPEALKTNMYAYHPRHYSQHSITVASNDLTSETSLAKKLPEKAPSSLRVTMESVSSRRVSGERQHEVRLVTQRL
mmetsp:Transcript_80066/g.93532  ORF Transcript_80066/g.93532 Transcript_80066/m.93532 type:complete len:115 (+) Transcript_80066:29-373(+)